MEDVTTDDNGGTTEHQAEDRFKAVLNHLSIMEAMIESEAIALMEEFRSERERLKQLAKAAATPQPGEQPTGFYSPLNLSVRAWKGTLEIYWFEQHVVKATKRRVFKYLPRNTSKGKGGGGYNLTTLLARANPFERDLVESVERRATELRTKRGALVKARRAVRDLSPWYSGQDAACAAPDAPPDDGADATGLVPLQSSL